MHTSRTLPRPGKAMRRERERERARGRVCPSLPPSLVPRRFSLLFIKTLKFLEQLRTIISRDGEIATEERSNLCRQHFSTTKKPIKGILSLLEKNLSLFRVTSGRGREGRYIYTRFVFNPGILFYFHYLFISLILTQSLTGNWKLLNLNERELRD